MRSSAWHRLFSSRHSTSALADGWRYSPITSQNFSSNFGSFESLKVFRRCGLRSFLNQRRWTELAEMPAWRLIERMLQRRLPSGGRVVSVSTRASFASGIDALRPRPGLSANPSRPEISKRLDHVETRFGVVFSCSATAWTPTPASRSRMMSARSRSRTSTVADRDRRRSSLTALGSACSRSIGRPAKAVLPKTQLTSNHS